MPDLFPQPDDTILIEIGIGTQDYVAPCERCRDNDAVKRAFMMLWQKCHPVDSLNSYRNNIDIKVVGLLLQSEDIGLQRQFADAIFNAQFPEGRNTDSYVIVRIGNHVPNASRKQIIISPKPDECMGIN